jgi:hypothetical protein
VYIVGDNSLVLHSGSGPTGFTPQTATAPSGKPAYRAIWGSSASDIYVVGEGGVIMHSTGGGNWSPQTSGVSTDLYAVWGTGSHVYAAGAGGVIVHSQNSGANWDQENS